MVERYKKVVVVERGVSGGLSGSERCRQGKIRGASGQV